MYQCIKYSKEPEEWLGVGQSIIRENIRIQYSVLGSSIIEIFGSNEYKFDRISQNTEYKLNTEYSPNRYLHNIVHTIASIFVRKHSKLELCHARVAQWYFLATKEYLEVT